ncbi:hypothetical protein [Sutterella wadsworthensis]|uniref:hypothetical protein n=1 Tax=Sutterella wadsworthensis TaxID=40545 RepID=UPI0013F6700F|nr:hypothetical protein [Sutterella wadsworthensis]
MKKVDRPANEMVVPVEINLDMAPNKAHFLSLWSRTRLNFFEVDIAGAISRFECTGLRRFIDGTSVKQFYGFVKGKEKHTSPEWPRVVFEVGPLISLNRPFVKSDAAVV